MPINRSAPTPQFIDYVTKYALIDPATQQIPSVLNNFFLNGIRVPTFQRGISWTTDQVLEFLESQSVLLGHVILTKVQQQTFGELVDGLQRFATGTALLNALYPKVLMANNPQFPNHAGLFAALAIHSNSVQPVFVHNDQQLRVHKRQAIQDQYRDFASALDTYVGKLLSSGAATEIAAFASNVVRCFLNRQIAIDDFTGFQSMGELVNTFIGINTIRVELSTVDLVRTLIVDNAQKFPATWSASQIEATENDITETFSDEGVPTKEVLPVATVVQKLLSGPLADQVFPMWATGSSPTEVAAFLTFIGQATASAGSNTFIKELALSGSLPFSIMVLYYYKRLLVAGSTPSYLLGGNAEDADLHDFLRATYRALLAGTIGQLGPVAEKVLRGTYQSLNDVATEINNTTGAGPLSASPTPGWIKAQLLNINKEKAKRVFNACLLPLNSNLGGPFQPMIFGRASNMWQIDHLIPEKLLVKARSGYLEGQRIQNFAPLVSQQNKAASNTQCSSKLAPGGIYENLVLTTTGIHPFLSWLVGTQLNMGAPLDDQTLLQPNSAPNVGDQRIAQLDSMLASRI